MMCFTVHQPFNVRYLQKIRPGHQKRLATNKNQSFFHQPKNNRFWLGVLPTWATHPFKAGLLWPSGPQPLAALEIHRAETAPKRSPARGPLVSFYGGPELEEWSWGFWARNSPVNHEIWSLWPWIFQNILIKCATLWSHVFLDFNRLRASKSQSSLPVESCWANETSFKKQAWKWLIWRIFFKSVFYFTTSPTHL